MNRKYKISIYGWCEQNKLSTKKLGYKVVKKTLFLSVFCSASPYHLYLKLSSSQGHRMAVELMPPHSTLEEESEHFKQEF